MNKKNNKISHRRRTGAFFTPTIWVAESHKMLCEQFGDDYKQQYVIWDCAAGTANLTRNYKFKELYISTLDQSDINTINDCGYNPEATVFQYDFLNEVGIDSCPDGLKKAFEDGKKVLFLINPPYGTACSGGSNTNHKKNIAKTIINDIMLKNKIGNSSQQLYAQFMYKILLLEKKYSNNVVISFYSKPAFMTASSFGKFRKIFYNNFEFKNGMLFQASNFSEVSGQWGISFTIWKSSSQISNKSIILDIKEVDNFTYNIHKIEEKKIYSGGEKEASQWIRKEIKNIKTEDAPQLSSTIIVKQKGRGKLIKNSLGYVMVAANNVYTNMQSVALFSSCSSQANGLSIIPENFMKVVSLFTARKSIKGNWINDKDEYLIPNTKHPEYNRWNQDCIIYSLFNNSSQQSSLRNINYKDKKWDIFNNFFFMSNEEMLELADEVIFNELYQDAKKFNEDRYVYKSLQNIELSPDAKELLDMAKDLVRKSMKMRIIYYENNKNYYLNSWDSGYAQLKNLWKNYYKEEFNLFREKYKIFENRMREGVYKFGFLLE